VPLSGLKGLFIFSKSRVQLGPLILTDACRHFPQAIPINSGIVQVKDRPASFHNLSNSLCANLLIIQSCKTCSGLIKASLNKSQTRTTESNNANVTAYQWTLNVLFSTPLYCWHSVSAIYNRHAQYEFREPQTASKTFSLARGDRLNYRRAPKKPSFKTDIIKPDLIRIQMNIIYNLFPSHKNTFHRHYWFYAVRMKCNQFTTQVLLFASFPTINSDWIWEENGQLFVEHLR
jgi:hypothetical protein